MKALKIIVSVLIIALGVTAIFYKQNEILMILGLPQNQVEEGVQNEEKNGDELDSKTTDDEGSDEIDDAFGLVADDNEEGDETIKPTSGSYEEKIEAGKAYAQQGFYDLAAEELVSAINSNPEKSEAYVELGRVKYAVEDYFHATENLKKAREKGDQGLNTGILLVRSLIEDEKFDEAQLMMEEVDDGSDDADLLYTRGLIAMLRGNRSVAGGSMSTLVELYPENELSVKAQKYLDAYHEFDFFQDGKPSHLRALLAKAMIQNGEYALSTEILRQVITGSPNYRDAWTLMGYAHFARENYISAVSSFERAVEVDPTNPEAQYFLGLAYANIDEYDKAVIALRSAIENDFQPKGQVISKLADVYFTLEEYRKAAEEYENYLKLDGNQNVENYVRPIWIYLDFIGEDGLDDAMRLATDAVSNFPEEALAYNLLGWTLIYDENYEGANKALNKAKELDPDLAAVYLNLGMLHEQQGEMDDAKEYYKTAYDKDDEGGIANLAANRYNSILNAEKETTEE